MPSISSSGLPKAHIPTIPWVAAQAFPDFPPDATPTLAKLEGSAASAVGIAVGNSRLRPITTLPSEAFLVLKFVHIVPPKAAWRHLSDAPGEALGYCAP